MRELNTIQKREKLNTVYALDDPGIGGASHEYKITPNGMIKLDSFRNEWLEYRKKMDFIMMGLPMEGEGKPEE